MVSVVVPTRNRAHLLSQTLDSVQNQTLSEWECVVIDDHSTDETPTLVRERSAADPRVIYASLPEGSRGGNAARNLGVARARGEFILFLDSDDLLAGDCLEQRTQELEARPELDFAVWPTLLFEQEPGDSPLLWNVATDEDDLDRFLALDIPWQTSGPLWRRQALVRVGPWKEGLLNWQDWDFHLRALLAGLRYRWFDTPDTYWRKPRGDSLWNNSDDKTSLDARIDLLDELLGRFRHAGKLGERQRHLFGGLYFWYARFWYSRRRDRFCAGMVWMHAWRCGLVSLGQFLQGCRWFSRLTRGRSSDVRQVFPDWPPEYRIGASTTFQKTSYRKSVESP